MPKELHEIKNFQYGIISSPSTTDIPEEAATFSKNIDPTAAMGTLDAIKEDALLSSGINATASNIREGSFTYYNPDDKKFVRISDFENIGSSSSDFIYTSDWITGTTVLNDESIDGISANGNASVTIVDETDSSENRKNVLRFRQDSTTTTYASVRMFTANYQWGVGDTIRVRFDYFIPSGSDIDRVRPYVGGARAHRANSTQIWNVKDLWATYDVELAVADLTGTDNDNSDFYLRIYWSQDGDSSNDLVIPSGNYAYIDNLVIQKNREVSQAFNPSGDFRFPTISKRNQELFIGMGTNESPKHISEENFVQDSELVSPTAESVGNIFTKMFFYQTSGNENKYLGWAKGDKNLYRISHNTSNDTITVESVFLDLEDVETIGISEDRSRIWVIQKPDDRTVNPCYIYHFTLSSVWALSVSATISTTSIPTSYASSSYSHYNGRQSATDDIRAFDVIETSNSTDNSDNTLNLWIMFGVKNEGQFSVAGVEWSGGSKNCSFLYSAQCYNGSSLASSLAFSDKSFPGKKNLRIVPNANISFSSSATAGSHLERLSFKTYENSLVSTQGNHSISLGLRFGEAKTAINGSIPVLNYEGDLTNDNVLYSTNYNKTTNWYTANTEGSTNFERFDVIERDMSKIGLKGTTNTYHFFSESLTYRLTPLKNSGSLISTISNEEFSNESDFSISNFIGDISITNFLGQDRDSFGRYFKYNNNTIVMFDENEMDATISAVAGAPNLSQKDYSVKFSFLYDGYQESPLNSIDLKTFSNLAGDNNKGIIFTLKIKPDSIPKRVKSVIVYVKDGANYRFLEQKSLNSFYSSGDKIQQIYTIAANGANIALGATYEARTGCPQTIKRSIVNYSMSEELNGELFVADCFIPETQEEANNYIFKSKPGNFSQFNWINDNLLLPERPTAIKSFNGRLYAFTLTKFYRINPDGMYIEDVNEGIGCLNKHCAITTEYGLFFIDKNGAYLHNGTNINRISAPIETFSYASWSVGLLDFIKMSNTVSDLNPNLPIKMTYEPKKGCILIWGHDLHTWQGFNEYIGRVWAYSIDKKRWDYWEAPMHQGLLVKDNGDTLVYSNAHKVFNYLEGSSKRKWEWYSKDITTGMDTQEKIFSRIKITDSMNQSTSEPPSSSDSLLIVPDNSGFAQLTKKKDYYKLSTKKQTYNSSLCSDDGGVFTSPSGLIVYNSPGDFMSSLYPSWFGTETLTYQNIKTAKGIVLFNPTESTITINTNTVIYMLDNNDNYAEFLIVTSDGNATSLTLGSNQLTSIVGSVYMKANVSSTNPWTPQGVEPSDSTFMPGLKITTNLYNTDAFLYTTRPVCTIDNVDVSEKTTSTKKSKTLQLRLREQVKPVDSIGIIYRRKSVK